jgi:peptidoglycan/xylan/chitin deacetylase (PgdA/CDA1 family)
VKKILLKLIKYSGLPFLFRELFQKNKVTILLYHDLSIDSAEKNFNYLIKNYNIIDFNDFIKICKKQVDTKLPTKSMIITFDDGRIGNYAILPLIIKYNIPVTIFLCANIINTNRKYWFNIKHPIYTFEHLSKFTNQKKLETLKQVGFDQETEYEVPYALTKNQIMEMAPFVNFQSHTLYHPCLPKCNEFEADNEISKSKSVLENNYGFSINAIAYPNGDYSDRDIELVKSAGYHSGVTVDFGFNTIETDLFRLKRISVNDTNNIDELIVKASGVWAFFKKYFYRNQKYGFINTQEAE